MIELDSNEFTGRAMERLSEAGIGERVAITRNGETIVELERGVSAPRRDLDKLREALLRRGIRPHPPEEVAAMKAAIADSSLSCRGLGVDPE